MIHYLENLENLKKNTRGSTFYPNSKIKGEPTKSITFVFTSDYTKNTTKKVPF